MSKIQEAANLLSDSKKCLHSMRCAVSCWPISAAQHLSKSIGKRPWLGQAACSIALGATEEETRIAWNFYMNQKQQDEANACADIVISEWESGNA